LKIPTVASYSRNVATCQYDFNPTIVLSTSIYKPNGERFPLSQPSRRFIFQRYSNTTFLILFQEPKRERERQKEKEVRLLLPLSIKRTTDGFKRSERCFSEPERYQFVETWSLIPSFWVSSNNNIFQGEK
jgi:hypothetical protein